jgi:acylphosphatase
MRDATTLVFIGRLRPDSFAEFIRHRAQRLALDHGVAALGPERVEVTVSGEPDLIDAFEMACSLGPIDCLVLDAFRASGAGGRSVAATVVGGA